MTAEPTLNEVRLKQHLADAALRFSIHMQGNVLSEKHGYGSLKGLAAVARFIQERDGIPMHASLTASSEVLWYQLAGVLSAKEYEPESDYQLGPNDLSARNLMIEEAKLDALFEQFGDELAEREGYDADGIDAARLHLARTYGFDLAKLEATQPSELRKYFSKEMKGWTVNGNR